MVRLQGFHDLRNKRDKGVINFFKNFPIIEEFYYAIKQIIPNNVPVFFEESSTETIRSQCFVRIKAENNTFNFI